MSIGIRATRNELVNLAMLGIFSLLVTTILYYIFSQVLYNPMHPLYGGGEVFLLPRYTLSQNDIKAFVFNRWDILFELAIFISIVVIVIYKKQQYAKWSFKKFLFIVFICNILIELAFTLLPLNGFNHIGIQAASINNGMYIASHSFHDKLIQYGINDFFSLEWLRYLYINMYSTIKFGAYPFVGATHPPGIFILTRPLSFLTPTGWGLVVGFINSLSIVLLGFIIKDAFSERMAKLTCIYFLLIPTVCIHSFSVIDGIPSVLVALAIFVIARELKNYKQQCFYGHITNGLIVGLVLTLAAQFTFGHAFPIFALLAAFYLTIRDMQIDNRGYRIFLLSVLIFPFLYFIFEYLISDGKVFYISLALERVKTVNAGLSSRQYPASQIANWIVMSVMGGIAFLPIVLSVLSKGPKLVYMAIHGNVKKIHSKKDVKKFVILSVFFMTIFLVTQSAVRLEVERTWHWFFLPTLLLTPYIFYGVSIVNRRLYPTHTTRRFQHMLIIFLLQMTITLTLAISIQDYY